MAVPTAEWRPRRDSPVESRRRRLLRPAALVPAACLLFLLAMAGCRMSHVEAAKQPADPSQTSPATLEPGQLTESGQPAQPDDAPAATVDRSAALTIAGANASESDRVLRFTVTPSLAGGAPVTVAYETADGSAMAGQDYEAASGRLTFPAESTAALQIEVALRNDRIAEPLETFTIALRAAQGAALAVATATGTVLDDDTRTLAVRPTKLYVTEGDDAAYAVSLGSQPTADVTVTVTAPAEAAELTVVPDRLVFSPARWSEAREVTLTAAQDSDALADAPVELAHTASGGGYDDAAGATVTATIVEDDVPTLAMAAAYATEDARRIRFEVTLSRISDEVVTVDYATESTGDTATEGEDYIPTSGTLRFPPRSTAAQPIDVTLNDDDLDEGTEEFTMALRNARNAELAGGGDRLTAPGSIEDEDAPPVVSIGDARLVEGPGGGSMRFPVRLQPASGRTVTVQYATANVTAASGTDYTQVSGTLTFAAGATERAVAVPIADDALDEQDDERFTVTLHAAVNAAVHAAQGSGTGTIEDNDPEPALSIARGALSEGADDGTMTFAVQLAPASGRTVTVQYETADITATAGNDYTAVSGTLTFRAGTTAAAILVPITDAAAREQTETFSVTLRDPAGATLFEARATGMISADGDPVRRAAATGTARPVLASLLVTGGAGTMYPAFDAQVLHYALACRDATTLSITAQAMRSDAQLTLLRADTDDNEVASGTLETEVTLDADHDVAVQLSDGGETATYVVHCLPAAFPDIAILAKTDQVKDGLLLVAPTYGAYSTNTTFLAVLDNNGVPRYHRQLTTARADDGFWVLDFKAHGKGSYSVSRRPAYDLSDSAFGNWEIDLLDERFRVASTVQTVAPLSHTDGHDFHIAANGDYVLLSYYTDPDGRDFGAYGGSETQTTRDSVIQRRTEKGESLFTWNSWDHRDVLRVGNDCRAGIYPDTYAHLNGLQLLADGDYVASLRGCSQVLRIDGSTGAVEWKLGGTAPPADSGTQFLQMVDAEEVVEEFCGQHQVTLTSSDTVVMFDNGVQCLGDRKDDTPFSRAVEYDISSGTRAELLREYRLPERYGYFPYEGGVSVLDDFGGSAHWLISWGTKGNMRSGTVTPREAIAISEVDPATGTAHLHINMTEGDEEVWTYRAYRVPESDVTIPLNLP